MHMRTWAALLLVSLSLGCRIRLAGPYPPAPRTGWMSGDEAVSQAHAYCADRQLSCEVQKLQLDGGRWKVHLRAHGHRSGKVRLDFDASSGRLLKAKEDLKRPKRDDEDDDDDDYHRRRHDDDD